MSQTAKPSNPENAQKKSWLKVLLIGAWILFILFWVYSAWQNAMEEERVEKTCPAGFLCKPIIYLYPQIEENIKVRLDFSGTLTDTIPSYNQNTQWWEVMADPMGNLTDIRDGKIYNSLFWEWKSNTETVWDLSTGFVVKWSETREFLQEILPKIGLTPKEYNEFIVYWYPRMKDNPYNLIHFAGKEYTDWAPLTITPKPDSILRVFMVFKPLDEMITIPKQEMAPFQRKGFSVIEWGGSEIR